MCATVKEALVSNQAGDGSVEGIREAAEWAEKQAGKECIQAVKTVTRVSLPDHISGKVEGSESGGGGGERERGRGKVEEEEEAEGKLAR